MSAATDALTEIVAAQAAIAPAHEGLRDYARINLQTPAATEVKAAIAVFDKRAAKLEAARLALAALVEDGHPAIAPRTVSEAVLGNLRANNATIAAALALFRPEGAAGLALTGGPPEAKG